MNDFTKDAFLRANQVDRERLCADLGGKLGAHLATSASFHSAVKELVRELRELGHDLWSYDESDDFEIWGPNYEKPTGAGIVVTFNIEDGVRIEWTEQ